MNIKMREFLILQIQESAKIINQKIDEEDMERFRSIPCSKLIHEAEYMRMSVVLYSQNQQAKFIQETIQIERLKYINGGVAQ